MKSNTEGDVFRALIEILLHADDALVFLRCWNEGNFEACRKEWPEAPSNLYPDFVVEPETSLKTTMNLIDNLAESRHTQGHWMYNTKSQEARNAVIAALKGETK